MACAPAPQATRAAPPTLAAAPQPIVSQLAEAPQRVSFEISVDGESIGRVTVALFQDVPVGTQRFAQLAEGIDGASYRRSKFNEIFPEYIRNAGVKNLTYRADAQVRLAGGADTFALEEVWRDARVGCAQFLPIALDEYSSTVPVCVSTCCCC